MSTAQPKARRRFPGLDPVALQHPYDRAALGALQRVPGLDIVIRKFIELLPERVAYIQNVAQTVRVSKTQCPQLYGLLREASAILDVREPELCVAQTPVPNAFTSGHNHPYIVVTTSLLVTIISDMTLGIGRLVGMGIEAALLEWDRKSEFTADRAGLLAVQDSQVMLTLMMKFAGGTLFQRDQMSASEFLKQADLYEEVDISLLDRVYKSFLVAGVSHPLTIVRAREIVNWSGTSEYNDILEGRYPRAAGYNVSQSNGSTPASSASSETDSGLVRCPHCGREQTNRRYCSLCGGML